MALYKLPFYFKRWKNKDRVGKTALAPLYENIPFTLSRGFLDTRFVVVDCEMSGLDAGKHQLLSIGWIAIEKGRIVNGSARHLLIHAEKGLGDSAVIHGLQAANLAGASSIAAVLLLLIKQMKNSVLIFHHAPIDMQFLQLASINNFRYPLLFSYIDTMALENRKMQMQGKQYSVRLGESRKRYGLPVVNQHNALCDAVATAELFLAQVNYLGSPEKVRLKHLNVQCS
ncbi:DNA polymerase-3 subunit epsilon [Alteromonadaceae bacterium Bs31]|nr:DNA polymerase-3 subunit epsilon [Alteromonadaceae bacterium Bs31]